MLLTHRDVLSDQAFAYCLRNSIIRGAGYIALEYTKNILRDLLYYCGDDT